MFWLIALQCNISEIWELGFPHACKTNSSSIKCTSWTSHNCILPSALIFCCFSLIPVLITDQLEHCNNPPTCLPRLQFYLCPKPPWLENRIIFIKHKYNFIYFFKNSAMVLNWSDYKSHTSVWQGVCCVLVYLSNFITIFYSPLQLY